MSEKVKKHVLILSDTHIGSTIGLWPRVYTASSGHQIMQNNFQAWLWDCWEDMISRVRQATKDDKLVLVFNGDIVEGNHHRTTEIMTAETDDQVGCAIEVFKDLQEVLKPASQYFIRGTECHSKNIESVVGGIVGAVKNQETGTYSFDHLLLDVNGIYCSFAHHTSCTSRPYLEASAHSIALGVAIMEAARNGDPIPSVIARAHRHRHGVWRDGNCLSLVTGAWQGLTRHGRKVVPAAVPNPSAILLTFEEGADLPEVTEIVYVPESPQVEKV